MNIEKLYRKEIDDLLQKRGSTVFHITGIRHCDYKDKADAFIEEAAKSMMKVSFLPEKANQYDHEAVSCRYGRKRIGRVATYDLEKYYILAEKNDTEQLTGHFGHFSANVEDHLLKLYMPGIVTMDEISDYRKKIDKQKDALYGSWKHDAIDHYLVHGRHQEDAIACISQLKENVVQFFGGHGTSTRKELTPILDDYKDCSQYDISLEGQRERWDILLYLDLLDDHNHQPGKFQDELLEDVEDLISQIGGELVRSVSYKSYIERLTELVTKHLPSSETAQHYLNTLPPNAFDDIRKQVEIFPHHLYHLFHTDPEEFVRTIYYARIPRKYLDPFLSGIALVEAYDKRPTKWQGPDERTLKLRNIGRLLEEWYEDYCEKIVHYPPDRQLNALRVMRKQVLASVNWAEGSPRFGDNSEDINYLIFSSPNKDYFPRLKDFGCNFGKYAQGKKKDMAWEDYIPEKCGHNMTLAEFAYMFFCSALNYEIDRLKDLKMYDEPFGEAEVEEKTDNSEETIITMTEQSISGKNEKKAPHHKIVEDNMECEVPTGAEAEEEPNMIPSGEEAERNELIVKYNHFVEMVKQYKFFDSPAVKRLNRKQQGQLVRTIVNRHDNYGAYAIAMLCELNYDKWMMENFAKNYPNLKSLSKSAIFKHWADALCLKNVRAIAGNYNILRNPNSTEDKSIYKAQEYTIRVHEDYLTIKNNPN